MHKYTHTQIHIHTHKYINKYTQTRTHKYTETHTHTHSHTRKYTCTNTHKVSPYEGEYSYIVFIDLVSMNWREWSLHIVITTVNA